MTEICKNGKINGFGLGTKATVKQFFWKLNQNIPFIPFVKYVYITLRMKSNQSSIKWNEEKCIIDSISNVGQFMNLYK